MSRWRRVLNVRFVLTTHTSNGHRALLCVTVMCISVVFATAMHAQRRVLDKVEASVDETLITSQDVRDRAYVNVLQLRVEGHETVFPERLSAILKDKLLQTLILESIISKVSNQQGLAEPNQSDLLKTSASLRRRVLPDDARTFGALTDEVLLRHLKAQTRAKQFLSRSAARDVDALKSRYAVRLYK